LIEGLEDRKAALVSAAIKLAIVGSWILSSATAFVELDRVIEIPRFKLVGKAVKSKVDLLIA
jgi:hypothetical protein